MFIFSQYAQADLVPLIIPASETCGLGLMNPSIYNDNGQLLVNLRQVNYTFYHSERKLFQHPYGPLTYIHPEDDLHLRTTNWLLHLNDDLTISNYAKIDTSKFDTYTPKWDFVGLEDARLFRWDEHLYLSGVRRDTTVNGEGRMELSSIEISDNSVTETSRFRIPIPAEQQSYCEKNWMPILDKPYTYIKWCNPLEIVKVDIANGICSQEYIGNHLDIDIYPRGGSQVIRTPHGYLALVHEVNLFKSETNRKDAKYTHRFILWNEYSSFKYISKPFSLMGGDVEFVCGMCEHNDRYIISFGFQDNAAYLLSTDLTTIMSFMNE